MKVGIVSPYLETMGGGERYVLTAAEFFLQRGHTVNIFWNRSQDKEKLIQTFNLDLSKANFVPDVFFNNKNILEKLLTTTGYDLMFFLSDGSIPTSLAKKNILHFQRPFRLPNQKNLFNKIKLSRFSAIVCNSNFTKKDIDKTFAVTSLVLYPPVDLASFQPGKKENTIISVGRFFGPSHPKKQEILIDTFKKINLKNWELVLIGGLTAGFDITSLKRKIEGFAIKIIPDCTFNNLCHYYSRASIYWHAAGFGQDLEKYPEQAEHFGMSTVEAMAAGCVPIVFAGGGQLEVITESKNGFFWKTTNELIDKTIRVINNRDLQQDISDNAMMRARFFSKEKFFAKLNALI